MKVPSPSDFGLTDQDLAQAREAGTARHRQDKRGGCVLALIAYVIMVTLLYTNLGPLAFFAGIGPTFILLLLAGATIERVSSWLVPVETRARLRRYQLYLEAKRKYHEWFERTQAEFWNRLSGLQFEREVAELLRRTGIACQLTAPSDDKGIDIALADGTIIQCKAHKGSVGPGVARELYGTLVALHAPKAILISVNGFGPGVLAFVKDKPITLWDQRTLIGMQKRLEG